MVRSVGDYDSGGIDPFIDAYETAQARDGHAALADYLPDPDHPLYAAVLCELVRVDLEFGWTRGRPRSLEEYRAEYPDLFRDPERLRLIAFEEGRLRLQAGDAASSADPVRSGIDDLDGPAGGSLEAAALFYRRHRRDEPSRLAEAFASYDGPRAHSELFRGLHEADPGMAGRVADALTTFPEPGSDFAGFRLVRELGRGAFGRVYLARQGGLADRHVALKVSAELLGEAQALAQLQHTHVVPIYSAHRVGPLRAVCMPYFGATTLADVLRDLQARGTPPQSGAALLDSVLTRPSEMGPSPSPSPGLATAPPPFLRGLGYVQAVLWIGTRLADGLAHAHERGIIHRDLKPANVLLTDDGQPMLLDFNLAADTKLRGNAAAAMVGGTLPYMAPEALVELRDGPQMPNPRGDLYALGLILHELLTGRHPYPIRRGAVDEVITLMVADRLGPPPRVRPSNPAVSPAAESILRRCLEPDPADRYQDARQLLDDLQRQLDDRPLRYAPEPSPRERVRKWARRHPRLSSTTTLGIGAAILIVGLVVGYTERQRRFGPVEAAHALRALADAHESASILLFDPAAEQARRDEGIALCRRALERYGVLETPSWRRSPLVRDLPAVARVELHAHVGELLMLWARALARQAVGLDPSRRAGLVRDAQRRSDLAGSCYAPGQIPHAFWVQRAALARLAGDDAGARRADEQAARTPVRSARDYALLSLDDPEGAASRDALPALAEASRRDPRDFALWMNLGQCHAARHRLGEAEDCFTIAIVLRPESPWPYFHRGRVELDRSGFEQALLDFDRALRLRPDLVSAYVNRALARMGLRDDSRAIGDLTAALDRGAAETRIYFIRAEARARAGDRDGAARDRSEGLRRVPADAESWVARGLARLVDGPEGALADFEEALKLDPHTRSALQNKAAVLAEHLGRAGEAVAVLDRVVVLDPDFVPARVGRGVLLARLGRREAAHRDAEESRQRDPSAETTYRLACIYALTSKAEPADRAAALRMLSTALGQDPTRLQIARADPDLDALRGLGEFRDLLYAFSDHAGAAGSSEGHEPQ